MELDHFMFELGGRFLRCTHQLNHIMKVPLLKLCLVFTWRYHFLTLVSMEVSILDNVLVISCSLVFSSIKMVLEIEWFLVLAKKFRKWNWYKFHWSLWSLECMGNHNHLRFCPLCEIMYICRVLQRKMFMVNNKTYIFSTIGRIHA
jgi:hypothetical protein